MNLQLGSLTTGGWGAGIRILHWDKDTRAFTVAGAILGLGDWIAGVHITLLKDA